MNIKSILTTCALSERIYTGNICNFNDCEHLRYSRYRTITIVNDKLNNSSEQKQNTMKKETETRAFV